MDKNARPLNEIAERFQPSRPDQTTPAGLKSSPPDQTSRRRFPTPSASMATVQDMEQAQYAGNSPNRPKYADLEKRRLSPRFVEWLLGFPISWTELCPTAPSDSADSATPSSRRSRSGSASG
jgi:hypothetical protein